MKPKTIILDPGHGLGNKRRGVFDPGAVSNGVREADIAMDYANAIRAVLRRLGHRVIRTRAHPDDPCPIGSRAKIAREYGGDIMLSIHCNAANGRANGTETFYRGEANKSLASAITAAACQALGTRNRGAKTESQSQHARLSVMAFQPCFLLELGFIDNPADRERMIDPARRDALAEAVAPLLI